MSLRTFSGGASLILASCGGPPDSVAPGNAPDVAAGTPAEAPAEHVACAIGDGDFADACTIERASTAEGTLLTIRRPDGGFRRLRVSVDGSIITAADGAQPVEVIARSDAGAEIAIGDDRYRLPIRVAPR